jgi:hypothetical protein
MGKHNYDIRFHIFLLFRKIVWPLKLRVGAFSCNKNISIFTQSQRGKPAQNRGDFARKNRFFDALNVSRVLKFNLRDRPICFAQISQIKVRDFSIA